MVAGSDWVVGMEEGIQRSKRTLAVLSSAYLRSGYCKAEWEAARQADPSGFARKLLPVRVEECERPGLLGRIVSFDLFGLDVQAARDRLLKKIDASLTGSGRPDSEPAFPGQRSGQRSQPRGSALTPARQTAPTREPRFPGLLGT
jgi:hypothetical protein